MSAAPGVKALTFDVFGTVVDWRGSIMREVRTLAQEKGLRVNAARFADAWRAAIVPRWIELRAASCRGRRSTICIA